jgi:hypothetical protein
MSLGARLLSYQEFRVRAVAYSYASRDDGYELHRLYLNHCRWYGPSSEEI